MIITIDGPVATGKSTIAKKLAEALGFIYFDTGAMYRAVTYAIIQKNIDFNKEEELKNFLDNFSFDIKMKNGDKRYVVGKEDVTDHIRSQEVTVLVSKISSLRVVREKLVTIQRQFAVGVNAVFEGRDMGTVVFPDAPIKIFLSGNTEVRARRRYEEFKAKYPKEAENLTFEKVLDDLNKRDAFDSTREISPLCQAPDAFLLDTSDLSLDEVLFKILEYKDSLTVDRL